MYNLTIVSLHACYFVKAGNFDSANLELVNQVLPDGRAGG